MTEIESVTRFAKYSFQDKLQQVFIHDIIQELQDKSRSLWLYFLYEKSEFKVFKGHVYSYQSWPLNLIV